MRRPPRHSQGPSKSHSKALASTDPDDTTSRRRKPGTSKARPARRWRRWLLLGVTVALLAGAVWLVWPLWQLIGSFGEQHPRQPSRLYGRSTRLEVGQAWRAEKLEEELRQLGYRPREGGGSLPEGRYRRDGASLSVHLRPFLTGSGMTSSVVLAADLRGGRVRSLRWGEREADLVFLEPPLLASYYGEDMRERRPVTLQEVSPELVEAVLAVEDSHFYRHPGLSLTGIARAAWVNLTGGKVSQGGSTLTQQLVKNLYLSHERTWSRKTREALLAVILELRFDKQDILQAYLNEIYLGRDGQANLIGVGAASWAYFGKRASQLTLAEAATIAGMIRAPAAYDPRSHPQRCLERRNLVLRRLEELEWAEPAAIRQALAEPVDFVPRRSRRCCAYFAAFAAEEAARRFGVTDLPDGGYSLLTTLDDQDQREAEAAVAWGLESLEKGWEKDHKGPQPLQAALVSLEPGSGGVLAYVGGRDFGSSQFDRASQARRQAGSAFKPVVYATAFERGAASPATMLEDAPLTIRLAGKAWSPSNDDDEFKGWMNARTALEGSRNVPTVRLSQQVGLEPIIETARGLGVSAPLQPVPALALGAFELTPLELSTVYATLAGGGVRPPVHSLLAVFGRDGRRVQGEALPEGQRVLSPQATFLLTSILQGVFDRGTARRARADGLTGPLAGKTGTTNGRRDSWFAGYSPQRTTVVWVGYDDNAETRLSGARAALPIWSRFMQGVRPVEGFSEFEVPPGITTAVIDPVSGELATPRCPDAITEYFQEGQVPQEPCSHHSRWWTRPLDRERDETGPHPFRRWLRRVFGQQGEESDGAPAPEEPEGGP